MNTRASSISLEDLIALNDEMAALVRAGVPLEQGLRRLGEEMPGRLGKASEQLADRLGEGQALSDALDRQIHDFPPSYREMVRAGLHGGRLSLALEVIATTSRRVAEFRRMAGAALVYPLLVLVIGWCLLGWFFAQLFPAFLALAVGAELDVDRGVLAPMAVVAESLPIWWWTGVVVGAVTVAFFFVWGRRSGTFFGTRGQWLFGWLPGYRKMMRYLRCAVFADLMAGLLEHEVPLNRAIELASAATGDRRMTSHGARMAEAVARGDLGAVNDGTNCGIPASLVWLLSTESNARVLTRSLGKVGDVYHRRALHMGELARVTVPPLLVLVLGGSMTLLLALTAMVPWVTILHGMAAG